MQIKLDIILVMLYNKHNEVMIEMPAIVHQTDKRTGITYAYESISYWDKDKQQSRAKRHLIGRVDPATGQIIPTRGKNVITPEKVLPEKGKTEWVPAVDITRTYYGATYLLDQIGSTTGIAEDLKRCFPGTWRQILSIAYFLILEDKNPLYRFSKWSITHHHPYGENIPSQRSSELFASMTEDAKEKFFMLQGKRRVEHEFWAYDTTSISSWSELLKEVKYGHNKDHDSLPQINLAILFGEQSNLPFYYRKLPGNISDAKTLRNLLADIRFLEYDRINLVMDRGFYSEENINALYRDHLKFLIGVKLSLTFVNTELEKIRNSIRNWQNYCDKYDLYAYSVPITWNYSQKRPYKGDIIREERRMYLHLYYNLEKAVDDERNFNRKIVGLRDELLLGKREPEHAKQYETYFDVKVTPKRGIQVSVKQEAVEKAKMNYGYFGLISNVVKEPIRALEIYRNKDLVEKNFGNLKERLNFRRTLVSSEQSLEGKIFVEFVALIYLAYIKKQMQVKDLFKKYTVTELLDEFDVIECFEQPGHELRVSEMTQKQIALYNDMGVSPPRYVGSGI